MAVCSSILGTISVAHIGTNAFYCTGKECATISCMYAPIHPQTHTQSVYLKICRDFHFHLTSQQKPYAWFNPKYFHTFSFKFYKIYMVGVKENLVNCTILLTPKSNFFCLVYLDFSVCFIVKQPTRVVVHKTAFESWEHTPGEPTVLAYVWFMT